MKILVTGGAGFIGSHVCEALVNRGDNVVCVDDFNDYYEPKVKENNIKELIKNSNFKLYRADIRYFNSLNGIFEKETFDRVVHLAARAGVRPSIKNPLLYEEVNVKGTINLLELSRKYKIKNFVFGSSSSVYGINKKVPFSESDEVNDIISPYAATKRAAELMCNVYHRLYGLKITCLRFFTVYGPRGRPDMAPHKFTKLVDEGKEVEVYGTTASKRDYTYIADIVDGIIVAVDKDLPFEIINLGNSKTVELKHLISVIENLVGKKAKIKQLPEQPGDVPLTYADISKARKLLGYAPKASIENGMGLFVEWYKNQKAKEAK